MADALVKTLISLVVKGITERVVKITGKGQEGKFLDSKYLTAKNFTGKGVMRAGKRQEDGILPLLSLSLMLRALPGKGVTRAGRG